MTFDRQRNTARAIHVTGALLLLAAAALPAAAQPATDPQRAAVDELQNVYLACDHAATHTVLDAAAARFCSRYAEELLRRGFAGDFDMLLTWWREAKEQAIAAEEGRTGASGDPVELSSATAR